MEKQVEVKNTRILNYFRDMTYGENMKNLEEAEKWFRTNENKFFVYIDKNTTTPNGTPTILQNRVDEDELCKIYIPEISTIEEILVACHGNTQWCNVPLKDKTKVLIKISEEIEKQSELFIQIEIISRGILSSDTKKWALGQLAQYFRYYAYYISSSKLTSNKSGTLAVGVFSNKNSLANLGMFLAPALAAGHNVILQVEAELYPIAFLLSDIAISAGVPKDTLRLISSNNNGILLPFLDNRQVDIIALFLDLQNGRYDTEHEHYCKILNFVSSKTPMIIFDDADLDSACENLIEASWGYQSLLPWSTNTVLVQENIFPTFLNKLKAKMRSLRLGAANDNMVDVAYRNDACTEAWTSLLNSARSQGIETFQVDNNDEDWSPTLFIGAKVQPSNVLSSPSEEGDIVTVLAFRSIEEAINLANNSRQGLAASVWSENIGTVNEVMRKLEVCNVWVNSFGIISPEDTMTPLKGSGIGYFGGIEGILEYITHDESTMAKKRDFSVNSKIDSIITVAKKSQENWSRKPLIEKRKLFIEYAEYLETIKSSYDKPHSAFVVNAIESIYKVIVDTNKDRVNPGPSFNLVSFRQPRGVISVEAIHLKSIELIFTALFLGNAVLVLDKNVHPDIFRKFSSLLPNGVLNVIPSTDENTQSIVSSKLVAVCFGSFYLGDFLAINDSKRCITFDNNMNSYDKVTCVKNVWYDCGKSSNYN